MEPILRVLLAYYSFIIRVTLTWILLATGYLSIAQDYHFSYTYQNISRIHGGGTLEKNDTIEIRALMKVDKVVSKLYYLDSIPAGMAYIPNSMKIITNEGVLYLGNYTDNGNDDLGMYISSGKPRLRINLGSGAANVTTGNFNSATAGGTINPGDKPKFYGTTLFVVAYRLRVTANFGDIIHPTGAFFFTDSRGFNKRQRFDYPGIKVLHNDGLCTNFSSASFTAESGFGSGIVQNRPTGANVPGYTKVNLGPNSPQDNYYSIANNTSADGTTNNSGPYKPATNNSRVFGGFWDIVGDHTDAIDPHAGNPPVAPGTNGGYMLVVNSAYPTGEAYNDMIMDVCPNTYYEFSAWVRNICGYCGLDQDSKQTFTPGVLPNLAFTINNIDYYTTGEIPYTQKWVKRGFLYRTGPTETSFKITIKNNAPGGGGNDWVLDDIKLATCYPDLLMNPQDTAKVCANAWLNLRDTVRSYFDNYTYYCWEKSIDNGISWTGTGNCGTKTPLLKNGMWEYVVDTAFIALFSDSGTSYRVKVATTAANMTNAKCAVENSQKVYLKVFNYDCTILETELKNFIGNVDKGYPRVQWTSVNETGLKNFELERSFDGINFNTLAVIEAKHSLGGNYKYIDTGILTGTAYYRIKLNPDRSSIPKYSKVISLYNLGNTFSLVSTNPFRNQLYIDVSTVSEGSMEMNLFDSYGRQVKKQTFRVDRGTNRVIMDGMSTLQPGMYILKAYMNGVTVQQKLMKVN